MHQANQEYIDNTVENVLIQTQAHHSGDTLWLNAIENVDVVLLLQAGILHIVSTSKASSILANVGRFLAEIKINIYQITSLHITH